MTERTPNVRPARVLERSYANGGYHSNRSIPEARTEDNQIANRAYRGNHRAGSLHHADDPQAYDHQADDHQAQQRSSRVGRHHAEQPDDYINRR